MTFRLSAFVTALAMANIASAATEINLHHTPAAYIKKIISTQTADSKVKIIETRTDTDFNGTTHTRIQQTYEGIPVWHAVGIIHTPHAANTLSAMKMDDQSTMNGMIYESLEKDLSNAPAFTPDSATKALAISKHAYSKTAGFTAGNIESEAATPVIFIDENKVAHRAYLTSFTYSTASEIHKPTSIVDATTHHVYKTWEGLFFDDAQKMAIKTARAQLTSLQVGDDDNQPPHLYKIMAGGIGGNAKMGDVVYDGLDGHPQPFEMIAFDINQEVAPEQFITIPVCVFKNDMIDVFDMTEGGSVISACFHTKRHNDLAWLSGDKDQTRWTEDEMNDGYSPSLDAFYAATMVKNMYQDWFNVPALINENGDALKYHMRVHYGHKYDNAFWDGKEMTFGDGGTHFYPLTSVGVTAHEISHGFTDTHAHIDNFNPQMAALHESFSDMAAVSIENYMTGKNSWSIGAEIMKNEGALRYLDNPTKDGKSIDNMKEFDATEAHAGAGITNKAFYLLATTKGWDTRKAFNVMVKANMNYWNASMTTLTDAACGVVSATKDYGYNVADVRVAFAKVGIDTDSCEQAPPTQ